MGILEIQATVTLKEPRQDNRKKKELEDCCGEAYDPSWLRNGFDVGVRGGVEASVTRRFMGGKSILASRERLRGDGGAALRSVSTSVGVVTSST